MAKRFKFIPTRMVFYLRRFSKEMRKEMGLRIEELGKEAVRQVKQNISTPTASAGPSSEGQMPHMDSGLLQESIYTEASEDKKGPFAIVATDVKAPEDGFPYGWYWEFGKRPFLRPTVDGMGRTIRKFVTTRRGGLRNSTVVFK